MIHSSKQPKRDDVVLGGHSALPSGGVVLGGLEGVKKRLLSPVAKHRAAALSEALEYGQRGLGLVIRGLRDNSEEVRRTAYALLQERPELVAQQAVERFYARITYSRLIDALRAGRWREADQETRVALLRSAGLNPFESSLNPYRVVECPCKDWHIINTLWVKYSRGRFGFSVQQSLWQPLNKLYWDKAEVWAQFGDRVGWRTLPLFTERRWKRYEELNFSVNAPVGHLPFLGDEFGIFTIESIASRIAECAQEQTPQE
jgi:hypothetical protein